MHGLLLALALAPAFVSSSGLDPQPKEDENFVLLETIQSFDDPTETTVEFSDGSSFSYACDQRHVERGVVAFEDTPALVIRNVCSKKVSRSRGSVIWVHGGPFTSYGDAANPPAEQSALLDMGYQIIIPLYPGSADREYHYANGRIAPGMHQAILELEAVIQKQQTLGHPVILIGESFGALLAAIAAGKLHEERGDRLVMISPMLKSLNDYDFLANLATVNVPLNIGSSGQIAPPKSSVDEPKTTLIELVKAFFGEWLDIDLVTILEKDPPKALSVVYRDADPKVDSKSIKRLIALGSGRYKSLVFDGVSHEPVQNRVELNNLIKFLRRALQ